MTDDGWICDGCQRRVYEARVWWNKVLCRGCDTREANLRILKHEGETPLREHNEDGYCCWKARWGR